MAESTPIRRRIAIAVVLALISRSCCASALIIESSGDCVQQRCHAAHGIFCELFPGREIYTPSRKPLASVSAADVWISEGTLRALLRTRNTVEKRCTVRATT
jgi:hypothetical protein